MFVGAFVIYAVLSNSEFRSGVAEFWIIASVLWIAFFARHEVAPGIHSNGISLLGGRSLAVSRSTRDAINLSELPAAELAESVKKARSTLGLMLVLFLVGLGVLLVINS